MNAQTHHFDLAEPAWPPQESYVLDRRGLPVDISGDVWQLNDPTAVFTLDWSKYDIRTPGILNCIRRYVAWLLTNKGPASVDNCFHSLLPFIATTAFREADDVAGYIPYKAFSEAKSNLGRDRQYLLHYARQLYRWCVSQRYPYFSRDVANRLNDIVIGGNSKGQAVRSRDPNKGPLDAQEVAALTGALRAARVTNTMPLEEQAILWLAFSTGSNPSQYACLREEDLVEEEDGDETIAFILKVPRHKKNHVQLRTEFRNRRLDRFVGQVLKDLIQQNQIAFPANDADSTARPLFRSAHAHHSSNHPMAEWAWHLRRDKINLLIQLAVKRLGIRSRTGEPLEISTRRFRYTLASRLIDQGASAFEVADALDHSDLQNVLVYFEVHSNIVDHLDQALALALAPRAQAFAKIVDREENAERGNVKGSRCHYGDRELEIFEAVGTCGNHSFCNIAAAPIACYTCPMFQPWMDGPHDLVLDGLLKERQKRFEMDLNPKMVAIHDHVIIEVAGVIERIAAKRIEQSRA